MKKQYTAPDLEILLLELSDIITASMPGAGAENPLPDDDLDGISQSLNNWK